MMMNGCGVPEEENSEISSFTQQVSIGPYYPPVQWEWWPTGKYASAYGTTTACGDPTDNDVYLRYDRISDACINPNAIVLETNVAPLYAGIKAVFSGRVEAFRIDSDNTVHVCIGAKKLADSSFTQWFLANNLAIRLK